MKTLGDVVLIALYAGAIVLANGLVTRYGQSALPYTAFFLIPFDLVVRDLLQDRWMVKSVWSLRLRMAGVILGGSAISYLTTVASERVATASMIAFTTTGMIDAITYQWAIRRGRLFRINLATLVGATTDSIVFAVLAFDHVVIGLVVAQTLSKMGGGLFWSLVFLRYFRKGAAGTKIMVVKDGDTLLNDPNLASVLAEARSYYDKEHTG